MPLPNYGYFNKEDRKSQELIFEMAPELVDDATDGDGKFASAKNRKRAQITTGKLGIDLERKLKINSENNKDAWTTHVDPQDIEDARKFSSPHRENFRRNVKSSIDSLISGQKVRQVRSDRRPTMEDEPSSNFDVSSVDDRSVRFSLPKSRRSSSTSGPSSGFSETSRAGLSFQPSPEGTVKMQHYSSSHHITTASSSRARNPRGY